MKLTDTLEGLGRPVAYHPGLARMTGSVKAAIFLGQLMYWWPRRSGETIYKTAEEWEAETALTEREQRSARNTLKSLGILSEDYRRLSHQMHYTLHEDALNEAWEQFANGQKVGSRTDESDPPEPTKAQVGKEQKRRSSYIHRLPETTTETTTYNAPANAGASKPPAMKDELAQEVENLCTKHVPFEAWGSKGRERKACKDIASRCRDLAKVSGFLPEHLAENMVRLLANKTRQSTSEYWQIIVTPSAILSRWNNLVAMMEHRADYDGTFIDEAFGEAGSE